MGVYEDLVAWSESRPGWQRDALRRLATIRPLGDADLAELARLALPDLDGGDDQKAAMPITTLHVPGTGANPSQVVLAAIADAQNANSLAPGGRLTFAPAGMTIVYGDNGAGKSGYIRILKCVCRSRSAPEAVLPNLVTADPRPTAAAIEYVVDGEPRCRQWVHGESAADELGAVTIFDRACASVYLQSETEVAYRPLGLDLLDSLARAARGVRLRLEAERSANKPQLDAPPVGIVGAPALASIWPLTAGISAATLDAAAAWDEASARRLAQVERVLAAPSPAEMAAGLQARRGSLSRAKAWAEELETVPAFAEELPRAVATLNTAETALELARTNALAAGDLQGVGGALWRVMWNAAQEYSEGAAYVGEAFPHTSPGARCPLCAQELSEAAGIRFHQLRAMVEMELSQEVERARETVRQLRTALGSASDRAAAKVHIDELRESDPDTADVLALLSGQAAATAMAALAEGAGTNERPSEAGIEARASALLAERIAALDAEVELVRRTTSEGQVAEVREELANLRARAWIVDHRDAILADVARLVQMGRIAAAIADCDTQPITAEASRLTTQYVTDALRADFARELNGLNTGRVRVRIVPRGEYGATYHRLELDGPAREEARVSQVVSDGEFRAIALASFLAELGQADSQSAIVLDDPVSSLDHLYRERVANRLAREAGFRQVVVFTHDLVFLHDLTSAAERNGVGVAYRRLRLTPTHVGWPVDEPPWLGMKVRQRTEALQLELNDLRAIFEDGDVEGYEARARDWYGRLRETWERAVEEVLFGDAIGRYRHEVKTNNLSSERVWLIDEADVVQLSEGMTKSSAWIRGHDQPATVNRPVPPPDELGGDLASLRDWLTTIRAKRHPAQRAQQ